MRSRAEADMQEVREQGQRVSMLEVAEGGAAAAARAHDAQLFEELLAARQEAATQAERAAMLAAQLQAAQQAQQRAAVVADLEEQLESTRSALAAEQHMSAEVAAAVDSLRRELDAAQAAAQAASRAGAVSAGACARHPAACPWRVLLHRRGRLLHGLVDGRNRRVGVHHADHLFRRLRLHRLL